MIIKKGQWYTFCCEQDLEEADEDFETEDFLHYEVWDSEEEALKDLMSRPVRDVSSLASTDPSNPGSNVKGFYVDLI